MNKTDRINEAWDYIAMLEPDISDIELFALVEDETGEDACDIHDAINDRESR